MRSCGRPKVGCRWPSCAVNLCTLSGIGNHKYSMSVGKPREMRGDMVRQHLFQRFGRKAPSQHNGTPSARVI